MPPSAASSRPGLAATAPVNAPRSWPNSSLSSSVSESAAQLSRTNGRSRARRRAVDGLGEHLLADAGLAEDEHGQASGRQLGRLPVEALHLGVEDDGAVVGGHWA